MALFVAKNGQLQTIKGIYYAMTEDYIDATLFHNLVPTTATDIKFLYASDNPDLTDYQRIGYCDNNNFIEVWNSVTKYIIINPRKNYIYAPISCYNFFSNYTALTSCIFDNFDTRYVTNMASMFNGCSSLTSLDLSSFNTQNVTNMQSMFNGCSSLTSLNVSNFNTEKVTTFYRMFQSCSNLTSLNLSSFSASKVTNISNMFYSCSRLTSINLSQFNIVFNCTVYITFRACYSLRIIKAPTWNRNLLSQDSQMFQNCSSLLGGNGTTYSSSHINAEYARVDGENGLAGYFTAPN